MSNDIDTKSTIKVIIKTQKEPLADSLQNRCSEKFHNIHRKAPVKTPS